ncbi:MAG: hemolysin family protein [Thermodesulfobacteriota bacterium]
MLTLVLAVVVTVGVSFFCSLLESVLYSTRAITLEAQASQGSRQALAMKRLKAEVETPLAAILILNTLSNTGGAALAGWAAGEVWGPGSLLVFSAAFTLAILLVSEILPKTLGAVHWRTMWHLVVGPLTVMVIALRPLIWLTQALTRLVTKGRSATSRVSEDEILAAARMGARGGEISKLEHDLIQNIIALEEVRAGDIMTPRTVMFMVDGSRRLSQVAEEAHTWSFTRVPVYVGNPDEVVGYVLKGEVLARDPRQKDERLLKLAKRVRFVPPSANALDLLNSFLRRREHLCLVVDEYGGIMGLLTLEDVLETLVGSEIVDEKDQVADMRELARKRGRRVLKQQEGEQP